MGGSSKKATVGYKYYVGVHMALCHGPVDKLVRIRVGGNTAWVGDCIGGELTIDKPDMFGGEKREGGVTGQVDIEMGGPTQGQNSYLAEKLGADLLPAFRGVCCAVLRQVYIGLNPYLKDWGWLVQRIHTRQNGEVQWYDEKAKIGTYTVSDSWPPIYQEDEVSLNSYDITVPNGSLEGVFTNGGAGLLHDPTKQAAGTARADWNGTITLNVGAIYFSFMLHVIKPTQDAAIVVFVNANGAVVGGFYAYRAAAGGAPSFMGVRIVPSALDLNTVYSVSIVQISETQVSVELSGAGLQLGEPIVINGSIKNTRGYWIGLETGQTYAATSSVSYGQVTIYQYQADPGGDVYGGYSDMNPAHIIRECLTDANWGMGYPESDMGDSFTTAADTLYNEEMGISILWSQQTSIEDFVEEILRHIDAALYVDRTTGKFELKLIRDDYDESSLLVLDQSNVSRVEGYSKQTLAELVNEITVTYNSNETGQTETVTMQNLAMIQQQGAIIPASVEYMGFANNAIAAKAAARDLKAMSTPLVTATIYANREASGLNIGDVFVWNWTETDEDANGIVTSYIMRVTEIAFGDGVDNIVRIQCAQDVFALPDITYVEAEPTVWVDPNDPNVLVPLDPNDPDSPLVPNPTAAPQPALPRLAWEAPYYDLAFQLGDKGAQAAISDGECFLAVAAGRQGQELNADILVDSGAGYDDGGVLDFCPYAYIRDAWEWNTLGGFVDKPTDMAAAIGRYASLGDEIVWIYDVSAANVVTVRRGCLDTIPHAHAAGTPLIVWHGFSTSDDVEYANGDEVAVKIITAAGVTTLSESSAPVNTVTMEQRASRPYPPACVKIAGEWFPATLVLPSEGGIEVSWRHRDRLLQTSTPTLDTVNASKWSADANIGPEPGVTYSARLVRTDTEIALDSFTGISGTTVTFIPSYRGKVRLEVWSVRDSIESLQQYSHTLTVMDAVPHPWTPAEILGAVWVDADTATLNGSAIVSMADKIGGVITASQPTASAQPTLVSGALNGTDVMQFDGADWLSFGTALGKPANWSIFVVGMFASMGSKTNMCGSASSTGHSSTAWGDIGVGRFANDGKIEYSISDGTNYAYGRSSSAVITAGNWFLCCRRYTSGQNKPDDRVNGANAPVLFEAGSATSCSGTAYKYSIGRSGEYNGMYVTNGSRIKGFVCVPSVISDADAQRLEGYYAHLCGLAGLLPSDHPYKSAPPML